jgi:hypothetical protein
MSNPESYARIPTAKLAEMIDGLGVKINLVCKSHTAAKLVAHYDDYCDSWCRKVGMFFGIKTRDFLTWVKAEKEEWSTAGIFSYSDTIYYRSRDTDRYDGLIDTMVKLAKYSDQHALLADSDLEQLTRAVAKGENVKEAKDYLAKLEAAYPGLTELL